MGASNNPCREAAAGGDGLTSSRRAPAAPGQVRSRPTKSSMRRSVSRRRPRRRSGVSQSAYASSRARSPSSTTMKSAASKASASASHRRVVVRAESEGPRFIVQQRARSHRAVADAPGFVHGDEGPVAARVHEAAGVAVGGPGRRGAGRKGIGVAHGGGLHAGRGQGPGQRAGRKTAPGSAVRLLQLGAAQKKGRGLSGGLARQGRENGCGRAAQEALVPIEDQTAERTGPGPGAGADGQVGRRRRVRSAGAGAHEPDGAVARHRVHVRHGTAGELLHRQRVDDQHDHFVVTRGVLYGKRGRRAGLRPKKGKCCLEQQHHCS